MGPRGQNRAVFEAWMENQECWSKSLHTDGYQLFAPHAIIGFTEEPLPLIYRKVSLSVDATMDTNTMTLYLPDRARHTRAARHAAMFAHEVLNHREFWRRWNFRLLTPVEVEA